MVGMTEVRARLASAAALRCLCLASALATTAVSRLSASARRRPRLIALTARSAASSSTMNRTIRTMSSTCTGIFRFFSREGSERPVKLLPSGFQNSTDAAKSDGRTRLPATMLAPAIVNAGARGEGGRPVERTGRPDNQHTGITLGIAKDTGRETLRRPVARRDLELRSSGLAGFQVRGLSGAQQG